eukprot:33745-Prorocentrum_minimum.AAC.1
MKLPAPVMKSPAPVMKSRNHLSGHESTASLRGTPLSRRRVLSPGGGHGGGVPARRAPYSVPSASPCQRGAARSRSGPNNKSHLSISHPKAPS